MSLKWCCQAFPTQVEPLSLSLLKRERRRNGAVERLVDSVAVFHGRTTHRNLYHNGNNAPPESVLQHVQYFNLVVNKVDNKIFSRVSLLLIVAMLLPA